MVTTQSVSVMAMEKSAKYASWVIGVAKSGVLPKKPTRQTQYSEEGERLYIPPKKVCICIPLNLPSSESRRINPETLMTLCPFAKSSISPLAVPTSLSRILCETVVHVPVANVNDPRPTDAPYVGLPTARNELN